MTHLERRTAPRADYSGITLVRSGGEDIPSVAGNISESGILLFPKAKPRSFDPALELTFTLPRQTRWFNVEGRLVHQRRVKSRLAWGVRFVDPPAPILDAVREFVELRLHHATSVAPAPPRVARPPALEPMPRTDGAAAAAAAEVAPGPQTAPVDPRLLAAVLAESRGVDPTIDVGAHAPRDPDAVIDLALWETPDPDLVIDLGGPQRIHSAGGGGPQGRPDVETRGETSRTLTRDPR